MTLIEKLDLIASLEAERLSEEFIERIVEHVDNPEPIGKRYKTVKELMEDLDNDED